MTDNTLSNITLLHVDEGETMPADRIATVLASHVGRELEYPDSVLRSWVVQMDDGRYAVVCQYDYYPKTEAALEAFGETAIEALHEYGQTGDLWAATALENQLGEVE